MLDILFHFFQIIIYNYLLYREVKGILRYQGNSTLPREFYFTKGSQDQAKLVRGNIWWSKFLIFTKKNSYTIFSSFEMKIREFFHENLLKGG